MEFIASAILSSLCNRLIDTAWQEYELLRDVKDEVEKLKNRVSLNQKVLEDAEQKQVKGEVVRLWLRQLRQVLYAAEDILDEAATYSALETRRVEYGARWSVCVNTIFGCGSIDEFYSRRYLAHQIKQISMKLDDICKEKDALGLQPLLNASENIWPERRRSDISFFLVADKPCIVGRDDEKRKTIRMLMGSEPTRSTMSNVRVLSFVGMGGVGKTTLAKLVYNDLTVKQHFHVTRWVCVSENFDVKRITTEILEGIPSSPDQQKESFESSMNLDSAQRRLKAKIEGKKFLLVLDDVWEIDPSNWESLCEPLTYGGKGSRIMVTTRNQEVSNMVRASCVPLKRLSDEDLWPILKTYAFHGDSESHGHVQQLESIGRHMVKKLKGSPLAAKTIGRLLNRSLDVRHWKNILDSEIFTLEQHSNDISPVLKLSYDHLPGHLKQCFAYCSLFPKNYKFSRSDLAQHWVAQNFLQTPGGDQHFDYLLYMSFFEESTHEEIEESMCKEYVMHDLIHDLAKSISKDDCLRLGDDVRPNEFSEAIRHVSIVTEHRDSKKLKELCKYVKLRTLYFFSRPRFDLSRHLLDNLFTKLKRLRVLGLQHCKVSELPTSIGNLKHLRFVDLSYTDIIELPESLCGLYNLQVLKLEGCSRLRALPSNMSALVNLLHLESSEIDSIQDLGKLTALQELNIGGVKAKEELGDMSMLRHLRIRNLEQVTSKEEAAQARMDAKKDLEMLTLGWRDGRADHPSSEEEEGFLEDLQPEEGVLEGLQPVYTIRELVIRNYGGVTSPSWLKNLAWVSSSLERVELRDCKNWEVLPPLGQLRGLKKLKISGMSSVKRIDPLFFLGGCYSPGQGGGGGFEMLGFPSLESLYFDRMQKWEEWEAPHHRDNEEEEAQQQQISFLPRLHRLEISFCPKLKELPPLPCSLKWLNIQNVGLTCLPRLVGCSDLLQPSSLPSSLERLSISHDTHLDDRILATYLQGLCRLTYLCIEGCPHITSLPTAVVLSHLTALEELRIMDCRELMSWGGGIHNLIALQTLFIAGCPKLQWLPSVGLPKSLWNVRINGSFIPTRH